MKRSAIILAVAVFCAALFNSGCSTIRVCHEGKTMVEVQNTGWYLLNIIPLGSGDPQYPNTATCKLFRNSVTLDNNIDMVNYAMRKEGAAGVRDLATYTNDEYVFIFLLKRHSMHTSAELVPHELAAETPDIQLVESRTIRKAKTEEEAKIEAEQKALKEAAKPPKKAPERPKPSEKHENKIKILEF